ncbi:Translocation protein S62 [Cichlidogyrus casuarinus]|uniref:Translocation protein SEC62 n=1 Tax=Cichlidogyrus casuarinus TaxID=1844966 RepID=A0ABD2QMQ3_9PLAT
MQDQRKKKFVKEEIPDENKDDSTDITTDEIEVAIYLYDHLKNRDGLLGNKVVNIFKAIEAFDTLKASTLSSIEGAKKAWFFKKPILFETEQDIFNLLNTMTRKGMFLKCKRPMKKVKDPKNENGDEEDEEEEKPAREQSLFAPPPPPKRPRLQVQRDDTFVYGDHLIYYVWRFERPVTLKTRIYGVLMILALIACCFYPVWPRSIHSLSWYLFILAVAFFIMLMITAVIRYILFYTISIATNGKTTFWLFPNLFEDCGFFESFKPVYLLKYSKRAAIKEKSE